MKRICAALMTLLLLCACSPAAEPTSNQVNIVATTYPTYLAALAVTDGVEGVSVSRLDTGSVSCLHDYTLTVNDMKKLSRADIIIMNGAGMEDFLADALASTNATVIDCSQGIDLLPAAGHQDHDHEHHHEDGTDHYDSHYWMAPYNMTTMVHNLLYDLLPLMDTQAYPLMLENAGQALSLIKDCELECLQLARQAGDNVALITFHDGFAYFAHCFDLPLLRAIEEEAGSEASAKEIVEVSRLVKNHQLPVIFTEVNGSDATARAISRETGCAVAPLSMIMDGPAVPPEGCSPITLYTNAIYRNLCTITEHFSPTGGEHTP